MQALVFNEGRRQPFHDHQDLSQVADGFHSSIVKPRLIYLDTDVLLLQDIEVLWKMDMKGLPAAAVEDCSQTFEPRLHPIKLHGSLDGH